MRDPMRTNREESWFWSNQCAFMQVAHACSVHLLYSGKHCFPVSSVARSGGHTPHPHKVNSQRGRELRVGGRRPSPGVAHRHKQ